MRFILLLLLLFLTACSGEKCIDADDFGFPKFDISARYDGSKTTKPTVKVDDIEVGEWIDTGYVTTGQPLTVVVRNWNYQDYGNTPDRVSAWCPWYGFKGYDKHLSPYNFKLRTCVFQNADTCGGDPNANIFPVTNPPCILTKGIGLYGLIAQKDKNPNSNIDSIQKPEGLTFHVGDTKNNRTYKFFDYNPYNTSIPFDDPRNQAGGIVYKYPSSTIASEYEDRHFYMKIMDRYYSDNAGKYKVILKSGVQKEGGGPVAALKESINKVFYDDSEGGGVVKKIFNSILIDSGFQNIVRACLILFVIGSAIGFSIGVIQITQTELIVRLFKITIISVLLTSDTAWSFFYNNLFSAFIGFIDYASTVMMGNNVGQVKDPNIIEMMISMETIAKLFSLLFTEWTGFIYIALFFVLLYYLIIILAKALVLYFTAMLSLGIVIALAPIFLIFMLFNITKSFYENWLKRVIRFTIQPLILIAGISMISYMVKHEIQTSLGFRVCKKEFPKLANPGAILGSSLSSKYGIDGGISIFYWWFPEPSTEEIGNSMTLQPIPVPEAFTDTQTNKFCAPYECIKDRYPALPFLDPENALDKFKVDGYKVGRMVQFESLLILALAIFLLNVFNEVAVSIANVLSQTSGSLFSSERAAGSAYSSVASAVNNLKHNYITRPLKARATIAAKEMDLKFKRTKLGTATFETTSRLSEWAKEKKATASAALSVLGNKLNPTANTEKIALSQALALPEPQEQTLSQKLLNKLNPFAKAQPKAPDLVKPKGFKENAKAIGKSLLENSSEMSKEQAAAHHALKKAGTSQAEIRALFNNVSSMQAALASNPELRRLLEEQGDISLLNKNGKKLELIKSLNDGDLSKLQIDTIKSKLAANLGAKSFDKLSTEQKQIIENALVEALGNKSSAEYGEVLKRVGNYQADYKEMTKLGVLDTMSKGASIREEKEASKKKGSLGQKMLNQYFKMEGKLVEAVRGPVDSYNYSDKSLRTYDELRAHAQNELKAQDIKGQLQELSIKYGDISDPAVYARLASDPNVSPATLTEIRALLSQKASHDIYESLHHAHDPIMKGDTYIERQMPESEYRVMRERLIEAKTKALNEFDNKHTPKTPEDLEQATTKAEMLYEELGGKLDKVLKSHKEILSLEIEISKNKDSWPADKLQRKEIELATMKEQFARREGMPENINELLDAHYKVAQYDQATARAAEQQQIIEREYDAYLSKLDNVAQKVGFKIPGEEGSLSTQNNQGEPLANNPGKASDTPRSGTTTSDQLSSSLKATELESVNKALEEQAKSLDGKPTTEELANQVKVEALSKSLKGEGNAEQSTRTANEASWESESSTISRTSADQGNNLTPTDEILAANIKGVKKFVEEEGTLQGVEGQAPQGSGTDSSTTDLSTSDKQKAEASLNEQAESLNSNSATEQPALDAAQVKIEQMKKAQEKVEEAKELSERIKSLTEDGEATSGTSTPLSSGGSTAPVAPVNVSTAEFAAESIEAAQKLITEEEKQQRIEEQKAQGAAINTSTTDKQTADEVNVGSEVLDERIKAARLFVEQDEQVSPDTGMGGNQGDFKQDQSVSPEANLQGTPSPESQERALANDTEESKTPDSTSSSKEDSLVNSNSLTSTDSSSSESSTSKTSSDANPSESQASSDNSANILTSSNNPEDQHKSSTPEEILAKVGEIQKQTEEFESLMKKVKEVSSGETSSQEGSNSSNSIHDNLHSMSNKIAKESSLPDTERLVDSADSELTTPTESPTPAKQAEPKKANPATTDSSIHIQTNISGDQKPNPEYKREEADDIEDEYADFYEDPKEKDVENEEERKKKEAEKAKKEAEEKAQAEKAKEEDTLSAGNASESNSKNNPPAENQDKDEDSNK